MTEQELCDMRREEFLKWAKSQGYDLPVTPNKELNTTAMIAFFAGIERGLEIKGTENDN